MSPSLRRRGDEPERPAPAAEVTRLRGIEAAELAKQARLVRESEDALAEAERFEAKRVQAVADGRDDGELAAQAQAERKKAASGRAEADGKTLVIAGLRSRIAQAEQAVAVEEFEQAVLAFEEAQIGQVATAGVFVQELVDSLSAAEVLRAAREETRRRREIAQGKAEQAGIHDWRPELRDEPSWRTLDVDAFSSIVKGGALTPGADRAHDASRMQVDKENDDARLVAWAATQVVHGGLVSTLDRIPARLRARAERQIEERRRERLAPPVAERLDDWRATPLPREGNVA